MKILFACLILVFSFQLTFAQEKPKAEKVDEIGKATCEYLKMRIYTTIQNILIDENDSQLFFILRNEKRSIYHKQLITYQIYSLKADKNRFKIIYGLPKNNVEIEFWRIPKDAEIPNFEINKKLSKPIDLTKPFVFNNFPDDGICPTFSDEKYVELLKSNPNLNAHIVIRYDDSFIYKYQLGKDWIKTFTKDFGIARKRIKIFYAKLRKNEVSHIEFWLVPKKSRH